MTVYRFVGGPEHGKRRALPAGQYDIEFYVFKLNLRAGSALGVASTTDLPYDRVRYIRHTVDTGENPSWRYQETVLAPVDQSPSETERLLKTLPPVWL